MVAGLSVGTPSGLAAPVTSSKHAPTKRSQAGKLSKEVNRIAELTANTMKSEASSMEASAN